MAGGSTHYWSGRGWNLSREESGHSLGSGNVNHMCSMNGDPGSGRGPPNPKALGWWDWVGRVQTFPSHLQALRGSGRVLQGGWVEVSFLRNRTSEGIYSRGSFFVFTE